MQRGEPNGRPELSDGAPAQHAADRPDPAGWLVPGRQGPGSGSGPCARGGPRGETRVGGGGGMPGAAWGCGQGQRADGESGTQAGWGGEAGGGHAAGDQLHWGGGEELQAGGAAV